MPCFLLFGFWAHILWESCVVWVEVSWWAPRTTLFKLNFFLFLFGLEFLNPCCGIKMNIKPVQCKSVIKNSHKSLFFPPKLKCRRRQVCFLHSDFLTFFFPSTFLWAFGSWTACQGLSCGFLPHVGPSLWLLILKMLKLGPYSVPLRTKVPVSTLSLVIWLFIFGPLFYLGL